MFKKVSIIKLFKILLVFLTLSAFVVSCSDNVEPENPEPGKGGGRYFGEPGPSEGASGVRGSGSD